MLNLIIIFIIIICIILIIVGYTTNNETLITVGWVLLGLDAFFIFLKMNPKPEKIR